MTDAPDLARRFLALWDDYLTALLSNPSEVALLQHWVEAASGRAPDPVQRDPGASKEPRQSGPPADAAAIAGASRERDDAVGELSRRIARLEERLAAVERRGRAASRARGRNRRAGV